MKKNKINNSKLKGRRVEAIFQRKKEKIPREVSSNMWILIIATIPNVLVAGYIFGMDVYWKVLLSVLFCVGLEGISNALTRTKGDSKDPSAVITGLMLVFLLPANISILALFLGCAFSIIVVKKLFGGQGNTIVNPAVAGAVFLWSIFPVEMVNYPYPVVAAKITEGAATTPWHNLMGGHTGLVPTTVEMLLGFVPGGIGSVSVLAILVGGILLLVTGVITPTIPFIYLATIGGLAFLLDIHPEYMLLNGTIYLAAFFLLGDPYTIPKTEGRKAVYAFLCGCLTFIAVLPITSVDGILVAILLMNIIGLKGKEKNILSASHDMNVKVTEEIKIGDY